MLVLLAVMAFLTLISLWGLSNVVSELHGELHDVKDEMNNLTQELKEFRLKYEDDQLPPSTGLIDDMKLLYGPPE